MKKNIRIKTYLHILQQAQTVNFIKTLEEGIKLPAGDFSNALIQCLCSASTEKDVLQNFSFKFNIPDEAAKQLLQKLIEKGVVEYYTEQNPAELNRYHRQLLLFDCMQPKREFEENYLHQQKLKQNHVLILGIGGIGNFMATALAVAGVGKITIADFDVVEETNLNRQILFLEKDMGKSKAEAAAKRLKELNSRSKINYLNTEVHSKDEMEILLRKAGKTDYIILSADKPVELVLFASSLCKKYSFKYIKCGYMGYQGLIGPLLGYNTKAYSEIFSSWADEIYNQTETIKEHNNNHIAPSMAATNGILANITALEIIKDITGIAPSVLVEKRMLFNLKTMEMSYG